MLAFCWGLILPGGGGRGCGFVPAFVGTGLSPVLMSLVLQDADRFTLPSRFEEGKEKCPYDPSRGYTGLIVGKWHFTRSGHFGGSQPHALCLWRVQRDWVSPSFSSRAWGMWMWRLWGCPHSPWGMVAMLTGACPVQMVDCTQPHAMSFGASLTSGETCTSGR